MENLLAVLGISGISCFVTWLFMKNKNKLLQKSNEQLQYQLNAYKKTCSGCGKEYYPICSNDCKIIVEDEVY